MWICVPTDSLFFSLLNGIFQQYEAKVKQFRVMYSYWFVLPSCFLKGMILHQTLEILMIDNAYWISSLQLAAVLRGIELTPWETEFLPCVTQSCILETTYFSCASTASNLQTIFLVKDAFELISCSQVSGLRTRLLFLLLVFNRPACNSNVRHAELTADVRLLM